MGEHILSTDMLKCSICNKLTPNTINSESIIYPNRYCNVAIKLDCGHWLLDDCDKKKIKNGTCVVDYEKMI